jgi:uncharacterized membrane protein YheB (UPF0754 family)
MIRLIMTIFHYISGPIVGAIIGYITNYIAVRMLFRPLEPVYIGRHRLPFTPGIGPRRKDELAVILGGAVVDRFFGSDDLEQIFTSDALSEAFAEGIAETLLSDKSLKEMTASIRREQDGGVTLDLLKEDLCIRILAAALRADAAKILSDEVSDIIRQHAQGQVLKSLGDSLMTALSVPLSEKIEAYILNDARAVVMPMIDEEFAALSEEPLSNLTDVFFSDREILVQLLGRVYAGFMQRHVKAIVSVIDIKSQISDRVREMNPADVEALVLSVVKKELRYVVWLGALLGLIIGTVNIFI